MLECLAVNSHRRPRLRCRLAAGNFTIAARPGLVFRHHALNHWCSATFKRPVQYLNFGISYLGVNQRVVQVAWETRGGSTQYFYLNQRLPGGRFRKKYFGNGDRAFVESLRLERRTEVRRQLKEERQRTSAAEAALKEHIRYTTDVTYALMLSVGYSNERSRGWRRLRMIAPQMDHQNHDKQDSPEETATSCSANHSPWR